LYVRVFFEFLKHCFETEAVLICLMFVQGP